MPDSKIDCSSLDPSLNAERWDRLIESVSDRAVIRHKRRLTISYQMLRWSRPLLAAAAAVPLIVGLRLVLNNTGSSTGVTDRYQRAYVLARWADNREHPAPSHVLQVLGDPNVNQ
jgi:hypothetical protein